MENEVYSNMIKNNQLELLSLQIEPKDLIIYKYNNRYIIEYLLEKNIHSYKMDTTMVYDREMISYYIKYNVLEPLLNCHLTPLLMMDNDNHFLLDLLLSKLNHQNRMKLYHNLKYNSYWSFHNNEDYIIETYKKYGIELPKIFIKMTDIINKNHNRSKKYNLVIEEFKNAFQDHNSYILDILTSEIYDNLSHNYNQTMIEMKELINYKKAHPNFKFAISSTSEGSYNPELEIMEITPFRKGVFNHELSHLLFENKERINILNYVDKYEELCDFIDNENQIEKITRYLKTFHENYYEMKAMFLELYEKDIIKKYHSYYDYIKIVAKDILDNNPEVIDVNYDEKVGYFITKDNVEEVVSELLFIERQEYLKNATNNFYSEELMLENILDAILHGRIIDELLDIECLSGHGFLQFDSDYTLSFNECLANYSAIKKSKKANKLINDLEMLTSKDLIDLLDSYLELNRSNDYGRTY